MNGPIVYSHGFGTRADARGMFTDIAREFPERRHIQFDYNEIIDESTLRATSLADQTAKLGEVFRAIPKNEFPVDLIAHSQGGVIAGMLLPSDVRRVILIAPPPSYDLEYSISKFSSRPGARVNMAGESVMPRSDGSVTLVPASYWESVRNLKPIPLYNALSEVAETFIVAGEHDDIFRENIFRGLDPRVKLVYIPGDHNFRGEYRAGLLVKVKEILYG